MNSTVRSSVASSRISETHAGVGEFAMRFTSTRRGARLARRLASIRLDEWGYPYDTEVNESVTAIVGELAANAVEHGHVPGRDFAVRLTVSVVTAEGAATALRFRVEVSDTRTERLPTVASGDGAGAGADGCGGLAEGGRGLLIVGCLAAGWGVVPRPGGPGKTVWAEYVRAASVVRS
ncbi:ATP-binding protein [Streptomyces yunnanensis]|uniref:Anti-sigma regulatory factor (Ser/Thr protein kinase) n=2 Tax=Streptomyces TaxID=1883 RepID=A0A9X8QY79_9ACTN|nr:ATP-binding protein [Streptomyces yunnanensis]SHN01255.1 Anti-sigma regulatory factor (Ser/Thr protein kinase) [Streptomyces yunnanensis]